MESVFILLLKERVSKGLASTVKEGKDINKTEEEYGIYYLIYA